MIDSRIHPLLDWFQAVFNDCSMYDVLTSIGCDYLVTDDVYEVFQKKFFNSEGFITNMLFNFNGIILKVKCHELEKILSDRNMVDEDLNESVFEWEFPYIQLTLSGSTLDFLRSSGIDVNNILFNRLPLTSDTGSYHVTRVDFAFDFVNYMPNFLNDCLDQVERSRLPSGRLMSVGAGGGMCYTARVSNKERTLYLGSSKSNKLLRIYDKGLQYRDRNDKNPYVDGDHVPDSWIRIELQCRREQECHKLLYGCEGDMVRVLRYIYDNFALVESDGSKYGQERHVSDCWKNLFRWDEIPRIIQNLHVVQKIVSVIDRAHEYIKNIAFGNIVTFVSFFGWNSFRQLVDGYLKELQLSRVPFDSDRVYRIVQRILSVNGHLPCYISKNQHGLYELKE